MRTLLASRWQKITLLKKLMPKAHSDGTGLYVHEPVPGFSIEGSAKGGEKIL